MEEKQKSVTWVIVMVMLVIAAFGWGFAAAHYAQSDESVNQLEPSKPRLYRGVRRNFLVSFSRFVINAVVQLPRMPDVIAYTFRTRFWLVLVISGAEVAVLLGGLKMKALERELERPPRRRRRRS